MAGHVVSLLKAISLLVHDQIRHMIGDCISMNVLRIGHKLIDLLMRFALRELLMDERPEVRLLRSLLLRLEGLLGRLKLRDCSPALLPGLRQGLIVNLKNLLLDWIGSPLPSQTRDVKGGIERIGV